MKIVIEGIVSALDRTTHVSGGGDSITSTTHISIFSVGDERVLLSTVSPAMIEDGDSVRLAGTRANGQFSAMACHNLTSGWVSGYHKQGCAKLLLAGFTVIGLIFTNFFPLFVFLPLFTGFILVMLFLSGFRKKKLHEMVMTTPEPGGKPPR